jgi:hypothetical protein
LDDPQPMHPSFLEGKAIKKKLPKLEALFIKME